MKEDGSSEAVDPFEAAETSNDSMEAVGGQEKLLLDSGGRR